MWTKNIDIIFSHAPNDFVVLIHSSFKSGKELTNIIRALENHEMSSYVVLILPVRVLLALLYSLWMKTNDTRKVDQSVKVYFIHKSHKNLTKMWYKNVIGFASTQRQTYFHRAVVMVIEQSLSCRHFTDTRALMSSSVVFQSESLLCVPVAMHHGRVLHLRLFVDDHHLVSFITHVVDFH